MSDTTTLGSELPEEFETTEIQGVKLALVPEIMSEKMLSVIQDGSYEDAEIREIDRIVQEGERIVELGAGIGLISIKAAQTDKVEALTTFEANPKLIPLIQQNAALNGVDIETVNAVIDPKQDGGSVTFYIRRDFWASSLMPEPWGYDEEIEVPVVSFQRMLDTYRPTMLIVDIEGAEEQLFRDIPLTGIRKIYIELHQQVVGRVGMKRLFDFMSSRDFHYDMYHSNQHVVLFSHVLR